jgi:DNA invertase Pin-like site-specific DNA recombinase
MNNRKRKSNSQNLTIDDVISNMNTVKINNNSAIIYSRVSTFRQQCGTSLESQKSLCYDFCNIMSFNVVGYVEEVCSATQMSKQFKLNNIIMNTSNINLIILEPSRLSRNIKDFICLLDKCNERNIILHFAQTITSSNNSQDIKKMISHIYDAELESKTLSQRVKRSVVYRKKMKTYLPSVSSFGSVIKDKKLDVSSKEQDVITLVNKLFWGSDINSVNELLYKITGKQDEICDLNSDELTEIKYGNMRLIDIAFFLNNLDITRRGKKWYNQSVSKLVKDTWVS